MVVADVIDIIKKQSVPDSQSYKESRDAFYSITLHTKGARPSFKDLSKDNNIGDIIPPSYLGSEYQKLFDKFLLSRHPREETVTRNWRYSQYKPLTKAPFQRLISVFKGLIYQDVKHLIKIDSNKNDEKYLLDSNFEENNNFISLFKNIFLHALLEDPNGYIVTIPTKAGYQQTDTKKPLDVDFMYVRIIDILHSDSEDLIFKKGEKTTFWINKQDVIKYVKDDKGNWSEETENGTGYFAHKFGFIPAIKLGGIYNNIGYYESFISNAIPIADEFISSYSSEQLIDKEASHPYIQQATIECPTCTGTGRVQEVCERSELYPNGTRQLECNSCKGKKQISINPAERYEVPTEEMDKDMIRIINPNISVNQYHHDKNKSILADILDALNLLRIDEAQSGIAKTIDRDNLYRLTANVSDRLFEIKEFCIKCFIGYRSPSPKFDGYTIKKPNDFNIQTEQDLFKELVDAQNNNLPINIRKSLINEYVAKRHKGNDYEQKINHIYSALDPVYGYTLVEIQAAIDVGYLTTEDIKSSRSIKDSVQKLIDTKTKDYFVNKNIQELISEIKKTL